MLLPGDHAFCHVRVHVLKSQVLPLAKWRECGFTRQVRSEDHSCRWWAYRILATSHRRNDSNRCQFVSASGFLWLTSSISPCRAVQGRTRRTERCNLKERPVDGALCFHILVGKDTAFLQKVDKYPLYPLIPWLEAAQTSRWLPSKEWCGERSRNTSRERWLLQASCSVMDMDGPPMFQEYEHYTSPC